jgi:hypothetical protein
MGTISNGYQGRCTIQKGTERASRKSRGPTLTNGNNKKGCCRASVPRARKGEDSNKALLWLASSKVIKEKKRQGPDGGGSVRIGGWF